jgi:hypothetical protein
MPSPSYLNAFCAGAAEVRGVHYRHKRDDGIMGLILTSA